MDKIQIGDTFKGVNTLRKAVIKDYNEKNPSGGTKKLIDGAISHFLTYDKIKPNGYKIIVTHKNPSQNVNISPLQQTQRKKLIFKKHIDTLFQQFITTQPDEFYLTTLGLIKELDIFMPFYYEYVKTYYDRRCSNLREREKLNRILIKYGCINDKDYITGRMEKLQEFVYISFSKSNIKDIAKKNGVETVKLWQQGQNIVDIHFQIMWENNYIQPLIRKGMPPKYIIRKANEQYRIDNKIREQDYEYIYSIWKFTKTDVEISKPISINMIYDVRKQLNNNFIEKLKRSSLDCAGGNYHANNKSVLKCLIDDIYI